MNKTEKQIAQAARKFAKRWQGKGYEKGESQVFWLELLTEVFGLHYLLSATLSFILGLVTNYILSVSWVFNRRSLSRPWAEFLVFAVIGVVGLGLNSLILFLCTEKLGLHYTLSKIIATVVVFFWNFFARKLILFHNKKP